MSSVSTFGLPCFSILPGPLARQLLGSNQAPVESDVVLSPMVQATVGPPGNIDHESLIEERVSST